MYVTAQLYINDADAPTQAHADPYTVKEKFAHQVRCCYMINI